MDTLNIFTLLLCGRISCEGTASYPNSPIAPYYPEDSSQYYPDYGYPAQAPSLGLDFFSQLDRQGLEAVLTTPLVITAFVASLLGGFMSPLISYGISRMTEYEIEWPEVKRKIRPSTGSIEARAVESLDWIEALEKVNQALGEPINKRKTNNTFNKFLRR